MSFDGQPPPMPQHSPGSPVPRPAPAPGYAGAVHEPAEPGTRAERRRKSTKRLPLILSLCAVGVVLALVVVGAITITNVNRAQYGPDVVAQEYLDAVAAGDLEAAQAITEATVPDGAADTLLDPEIAAAAAEAVTDPAITEVEVDGDTAQLTASYSVSGQAYTLPLTATRTGRTGIFFDEWELDAPVMQTIGLDLMQTDGTTVNDVDVDLEAGVTEYAVMPGAYRAAVAETTFTTAADATVSVGFSEVADPQAAALDLSVYTNSDFADEVQDAVEAMLEECAESGELTTSCGFLRRDSFAAADEREQFDELNEDGVEYEIEEMPTVTVSSAAYSSTGSFFTEDGSTGSLTAIAEDGDGDEYSITAELGPSGTARIQDDEVVVDFLSAG